VREGYSWSGPEVVPVSWVSRQGGLGWTVTAPLPGASWTVWGTGSVCVGCVGARRTGLERTADARWCRSVKVGGGVVVCVPCQRYKLYRGVHFDEGFTCLRVVLLLWVCVCVCV